jgi:hypothetical protein
LRVLIRRLAEYELILNMDTIEKVLGGYYCVIPDVLEDDTADREEKTRTIASTFGFPPDDMPIRDEYAVFVFDDDGRMIFTGNL